MRADDTLSCELLEAARLAAVGHDGQKRKGSGHPYLVHPLRVARRALLGQLPAYADRRVIGLAAVLHDTLEDTDISAEQLARSFGARVASVVEELTQDASLPRFERRKKMVDGCGSYSLEARIVKLADRWDNMSEMGEAFGPEFTTRYCAEASVMIENMKGSWPEAERAIAAIIAGYAET